MLWYKNRHWLIIWHPQLSQSTLQYLQKHKTDTDFHDTAHLYYSTSESIPRAVMTETTDVYMDWFVTDNTTNRQWFQLRDDQISANNAPNTIHIQLQTHRVNNITDDLVSFTGTAGHLTYAQWRNFPAYRGHAPNTIIQAQTSSAHENGSSFSIVPC